MIGSKSQSSRVTQEEPFEHGGCGVQSGEEEKEVPLLLALAYRRIGGGGGADVWRRCSCKTMGREQSYCAVGEVAAPHPGEAGGDASTTVAILTCLFPGAGTDHGRCMILTLAALLQSSCLHTELTL